MDLYMDNLIELEENDRNRKKKNQNYFYDVMENQEAEYEKSKAKSKMKKVSRAPPAPGQTLKMEPVTQLNAPALVQLLKSSAKKSEKPPLPYFVQSSNCVGEAKEGHTNFKFTIEIEVLSDSWVSVPLFSKSVSLVEGKYAKIDSQKAKETQGGGNKDRIVYREKMRTFDELGLEHGDEPVDGRDAYIGVRKTGYCFVTTTPGYYVLYAEILSEYLSSGENGVILNIPAAPNTTLSFTVPRAGIQIKADPSIHQEVKNDEQMKSTTVEAVIPPSYELSIQWTDRVILEDLETTETVKYTGPPVYDAAVNSVFTIGEGMLSGTTNLSFSIKKGALSKIEVAIEENMKILSVSGSAIKKWHIVKATSSTERSSILSAEARADIAVDDGADQQEESDMTDDTSSDMSETSESGSSDGEVKKADAGGREEEVRPLLTPAPEAEDVEILVMEESVLGDRKKGDMLRILLDYGIEDNYDFTVTGERDLDGKSCSLFSYEVKGAKRSYGHIACEAKTSVELNVVQFDELAAVDVSELPSSLRSLSVHAILFAYKCLSPNYSMILEVTRHQDVGVLVSSLSDAHLIINYSANGNVMMKLLGVMQNTQKQFVKFTLPENYSVWSAMVNDNLVKASRNENDEVLLPLLKYQQDTSTPFNVALSFILERSPMGKSGTMSLDLPKVDVPMNYLAVTLYTPPNYSFGEFKGGIKEVKYFSKQPLVDGSADAGRRAQKRVTKNKRRGSLVGMYSKRKFKQSKAAGGGGGGVGIIPVDISVNPTQQAFTFEETIVMAKDIRLSASFRKRKKGRFSRRHLFPFYIG